ncbi:hypothetical protein QBC36DRAFT_356819 [Triangularia setosa]|uniref:Uncharacterized protein n=1 Tax=Triangularia setosa TaxID=2587417 RepID=A0AAN6WES6_9PEZI|nr:hypothetical protein QBC36DRAFT_356819 [Podospora setosa]
MPIEASKTYISVHSTAIDNLRPVIQFALDSREAGCPVEPVDSQPSDAQKGRTPPAQHESPATTSLASPLPRAHALHKQWWQVTMQRAISARSCCTCNDTSASAESILVDGPIWRLLSFPAAGAVLRYESIPDDFDAAIRFVIPFARLWLNPLVRLPSSAVSCHRRNEPGEPRDAREGPSRSSGRLLIVGMRLVILKEVRGP